MKNMNEFRKNLSSVSLNDVVKYLKLNNWEKVDYNNEKLMMFQGPKNDNGSPLELLIPKNKSFDDYYTRIFDVVRVLSTIKNTSINSIINDMKSTFHDILKMRIMNLKGKNDLSLPAAANDINALKSFFTYAACSEEKAEPYFERPTAKGEHHADLCRFGHTFEGSFGFTINSPIVAENEKISLFETPFERKVMERIIRSFYLIEESVKKDNGDILVNNYEIAMNSRMCESLLEISQKKTKNINFNIIWSPQINVPNQLNKKDIWNLNRKSYEVIEYAAEELKRIDPHNEVIVGKIVTLHSTKNPNSNENFLRQAIIKHEYDGRKIDVKLYLEKQGYNIAYKAHGEGLPIKVEGELYREGTTWKMEIIKDISVYMP